MNALLSVVAGVSIAMIVFHFAVYPALIYALARLRPRPCLRGETALTISFVTAAYNEAEIIESKIDNALSRARPADEVIIISDGSTDGTTEAIRASESRGIVALVQEPRQGKVIALNRAVESARSDILIFSDANCMLAPDAPAKILRNFADPAVGCVAGSLRVPPDTKPDAMSEVARSEGLYWRYEHVIKTHESLIHSTVGVSGCLLALRRSLWRPIPHGTVNDDVHLGLSVLRQGFRVLYEPEAAAWEPPSATARDEIVRRKRMTAGRYKNLLNAEAWPWKNPGAVAMLFCHKFLRLLMPFFLISALVANAALLAFPPIGPVFVLALVGQIAVYALAAIGAYAERHGHRWRLPSVAYYFVVGNFGALGGFMRYLRGRQSVLWEKSTRRTPAE